MLEKSICDTNMTQAEMLHNEHLGSTVNGTDDREAHSKRWVAALVQVRNEKAGGKKLEALGIENWIPTQVEVHQWSDRKKKIERVVIPMIVFIRAEKSALKSLAYHSFIYKLVTLPGQKILTIIPDSQIENLRIMLRQTETSVEMKERIFKTGDHVRIVRGSLKDLEGELCMVEADKPMVAVLIDCLGYACVSIDKSDLEVMPKS